MKRKPKVKLLGADFAPGANGYYVRLYGYLEGREVYVTKEEIIRPRGINFIGRGPERKS